VISSLAPLTIRLRRRAAAALAVAVAAVLPLASPAAQSARADDSTANATAAAGYWMVASDGGIFSFGSAKFLGSTGNIKLNQPIVGIAASPTGAGYWMVATDGGIFSFGDAKFFGSTGAIHLNKPIVGMASTPSGKGYWMVASDGGIFSFGDAKFFGSTGAIKLNKPIVGMTSSPSGAGYWMVASDGGIFSFGDASFLGSTGSIKLAKPITGMAASPSGKGYWFTASDGGIFNYGDAKFFGAAASHPTKGAVNAMVPAPDGQGYWQASSAGELQAFGSALDFGGVPGTLARPVVGMTAMPAGATGVPTTNPTGPGTTDTTIAPTTPTTPTTLPGTGLGGFSSTAKLTWGSATDPNKTFTNKNHQIMHPYAQNVDAITEIGNSVFIGGEYTGLVNTVDRTTPTGAYAYLAELDTTSGAPVNGAFNATVKLDGPVRVLLRSADGHRLYVGGEFAHVNGEGRSRLVALDPATGQIDHSFNPPVPNAYVNSMALYGNTLYIGGGFDSLGGDTTHPQLAALDAGTGAINLGFTPPPRYTGAFFTHTGNPVDDPNCADPNVPDPSKPCDPAVPVSDPNGVVDALAITSDGQYLLVGGDFLHYGTPYDPGLSTTANHQHGGLIAVSPATGALTTWQPVSSRPVFGLNVWPGDGKRIFAAAGGAGGRVIAFVPGGQTKYLWVGNVDGDAVSVASTPTKVYLVGHYDHEVPDPLDPCLTTFTPSGGISCPGGTPHRHLAAFDPNGQLDAKGKNNGKAITDPSFTAQADTAEGPNEVFIGAHQMYVGGNFSKVYYCPANNADGSANPACPSTKQPGFAMYPAL
jgi:hypothetical protein